MELALGDSNRKDDKRFTGYDMASKHTKKGKILTRHIEKGVVGAADVKIRPLRARTPEAQEACAVADNSATLTFSQTQR